jgi:hypothetical protein
MGGWECRSDAITSRYGYMSQTHVTFIATLKPWEQRGYNVSGS